MHYTFKRVDGKKQMLVRANNMYTDEENTSKTCFSLIGSLFDRSILLAESELDRLGGMLYCRLVGPARFLEWVMIDGLRSSNIRQC